MARFRRHVRYGTVLAILFVILWIALAIHPRYRADWAMENALVAPFILIVALTARRFPLSRVSYTLIFVFLCLHEIGAHYTYAGVPYTEWWEALAGRDPGAAPEIQRNHYDRLVHFCFGLLLAYPIREVFVRVAESRGFWGYYLPLDVTMALSMIFELIEWGVAEIFGGDLGIAYLGAQGDPWDAQKDMALATLGAVIAMSLTAGINGFLQRDFAKDWAESLWVKDRRPLGESAIRRMIRRRCREDA